LAEAAATLPGDLDVVCYFLSRREADADSSRFLAAVIPQVASLLDEDPPAPDLQQFRALWQRAAEQVGAESRHLLLVVDGLDEDLRPPGLPSVAALLPAEAGGHVHVLVSSRPHPEPPTDIPVGHPLRDSRPVLVQPFAGAQELAVLAQQEINDLLRRDDDGLASDVLGLLTAAAGPLAVQDLAAMTVAAPLSATLVRRIRGLLTTAAARSLQASGKEGSDRYQFAHESLLAYAQADDDLSDPDFRYRIHQWADKWRAAGWPRLADGEKSTPQYLLDTYPSTLTDDPSRLAWLTSDISWVEAAVASAGVDSVLADLHRATAANPENTPLRALLAAVSGQAYNLSLLHAVDDPDYVLRQLCIQAAELAADDLAEEIRNRLQSRPGLRLVPQRTTRQASRALSGELGRHDDQLWAVAVLPDGRVVTGGDDRRVLVWDPAAPGTAPVELGHHDGWVRAVTVLPDGRVVTGGHDGLVLAWDPAAPGTAPVELGHHGGRLRAVTVLPDGRVVTSGEDGRVLAWEPVRAEDGPTELGHHDAWVLAVAVLRDGRVVTGGDDGLVLAWDPAVPGTAPVELGHHDAWVLAVAVLRDGRVVTGGHDGLVLAWDPAAPGTAPVELGHHSDWVRAVAALPDGRMVTGGDDRRVLVWDPAAPGPRAVELAGHDDAVLAMAVLPDGRVVSGGNDGRVLVWNPDASGARPAEVGPDRRVYAAAVLLDGRVVTGGEDGRVLVWELVRAEDGPTELGHHDGRVLAVAVLPDGRVVTGGDDGLVLAWDPNAPGTAPVELGRHSDWVRAVAVLPDGRVVTGGDDRWVLVWDLARPKTGPAALGRLGPVRAVVVLPDGRVVTGGSEGLVLICDPAALGTGPIEIGRHSDLVRAVAVLPDGRVITGGDDGKVLLWDPARPESGPAELVTHDGPVRAVAVLADGWVVTGGFDRQVQVLDLAGASTRVASRLNCSVTALAAAPLGRTGSSLVIAHEGSGFSLWSFTG
jgi:WD40 repeat protein